MKRNGLNIILRLSSLVKPLRGYMVLAVFMGVLGHLAASLITVMGGLAILDAIGRPFLITLPVAFAAAAVFAAVRGILRYGEQECNHYIAFRLLALIRDRVFSALRRLAPARLDGKSSGGLISMITSDIELLEVFYAHTISPAFIALVFSLLMAAAAAFCHPLLGLYALASYLLIGVAVPAVFSALTKDNGTRFRNETGRLSGTVLENLRGLDEIMQYGVQNERLQEMDRMSDRLNRDSHMMKLKAGADSAVVNAMILMLDFGMLVFSAGLCRFDTSLLITLLFMSSFGPVVALASLGTTLQNTFAAGNRILDLLDERPAAEDIKGKPETVFSGAAVQNVSFSYGRTSVLNDASISISPGTIIGICGPSGSGKSTLLKLLMRFYDAERGTVAVSGRSIREINTDNLRSMESFMSQTTYLYRDSIRNNLMLAAPDASEEEMMDACRKASIHDFIMSLPDGYDTEVGELGETLSGGERQRIGLARAFLHRANLMLLDEPTSNLDSLNEASILKSLAEEHGEKTVVFVSHRPSTMSIADRVFRVEKGSVIE